MALVTYSDEIRIAAPIPEFGISQDDTLQQALEKMAKAYAEIKSLLDRELYPVSQEMTTENIKHVDDTLSGSGMSPDAMQFDGTKFKVEAERQPEDMKVTFKAVDFEIPAGSSVASSKVNISGQRHMGRSEIINTDQKEMTVNIGYNRFPVTIDSRVVLTTPTGDVELKKQVVINADKTISQETPYEIIDRTSQAKPSDLKEVIRQFNSRIQSLEATKRVSG